MRKIIKNTKIDSDKESFKKSWKISREKYYSHWTSTSPQNQIQLAFRNHWEVFNLLMKNKLFNKGKRSLEVGCGRGSISAYFSDNGYNCNLLDISKDAIDVAKLIFKKNKLKANFVVGDANHLPYKDNSFDVVVSIGLLEHFKYPEMAIKEQIRVLSKGGLFLGYIVPKYIKNIQEKYEWINKILKAYKTEKVYSKQKLFRSDKSSLFYNKILKKYKLKNVRSSGLYPLPMISHSTDFPFSLMPSAAEKEIVKYFDNILNYRKKQGGHHPWFCKEGYGQAFLIWGFK